MKAVARASISLNGVRTYLGRPATGYNSEFEIIDLQGKSVLCCRSNAASWWHALVENRTYVIGAAEGGEIARIICSGFFGQRRVIAFEGREVPCPHCNTLSLPGARITIHSVPSAAEAEVSDEKHAHAYLGIAFYLWTRQCLDDAYNG